MIYAKYDSAFSAMFVTDVAHGIDDKVCFYYEYKTADGYKTSPIRWSKVRYEKDGRAYFMGRGVKNYLDEFMEAA